MTLPQLNGNAFHEDPHVKEAIQTLLDRLEHHKSNITEVRPPQPELKVEFDSFLDEYGKIRGGSLYFRYISSGIGNGPLVELIDGSVKYDFINGVGVHHFGHSHTDITRAALQGALEDTVMQGHLQQSAYGYKLSKTLTQEAQKYGSKLNHCFLSSTGVMAGENALKAAFQKNHPAERILAFEGCFSGRTITFSQITDKAAYRDGLPNVLNVDYIPFFDELDPEGSTLRAEEALRNYIKRFPKKHAAMFFELILGEGGYYPATKDFHRRLMTICKEHGIATLADEVQSFGRTNKLFAFQYFELDDLIDVVWVGKSSQVCATLFTDEFIARPGLLSQTFTASSTAIQAGQTIVSSLINEGYLGEGGKIDQIHERFVSQLKALSKKYPNKIRGPFGIGAMVAFTPYGGDFEKCKNFIKQLYDNGVISFLAGSKEPRVRFLPPVGATEMHHIDNVCQIIEQTLNEIT